MSGFENARDAIFGMVRRMRGHPRHGVQQALASVHLGSSHGGYKLCLDGVDASSIVYSVGIGEDVSFDLASERASCNTRREPWLSSRPSKRTRSTM
jgi:hypothetical protein